MEGDMKPQVILFDQRRASEAYEAHSALLRTERLVPALKRNPHWIMLRQDAFERFAEAFKALT